MTQYLRLAPVVCSYDRGGQTTCAWSSAERMVKWLWVYFII